MPDEPLPQSQLSLYQTADAQTRIQVRLEGETVWLTQAQMAELFQTSIPNVNMHIRNVFAEGELERGTTDKESLSVQPAATVKDFLIVRQEGSRQVSRTVEHYNLDVLFAGGSAEETAREEGMTASATHASIA